MSKNMPVYAENIIVFVKYNQAYKWFVTEGNFWILDKKKRLATTRKLDMNKHRMLKESFEHFDFDAFSDRFGIGILDEDTAEEFLQHIAEFEMTTGELREILEQRTYEDITDMAAVLYVNFDDKKMISFYPEPAPYEEFVPDGWIGEYRKFYDDIPDDHRYWMSHGIDLFLQAEKG